MTALISVSLVCTKCSRGYPEAFETIKEVRSDAKENGWAFKKVQNGSFWDFCPICIREKVPEDYSK